MPHLLESIAQWPVAEVQRQLRSPEHADWVEEALLRSLLSHEIDGAALLELTKDDVRDDLGVRSLGRIKRVLRGIRRLVAQAPPQPTPPDEPIAPADPETCDAPICSADLRPHCTTSAPSPCTPLPPAQSPPTVAPRPPAAPPRRPPAPTPPPRAAPQRPQHVRPQSAPPAPPLPTPPDSRRESGASEERRSKKVELGSEQGSDGGEVPQPQGRRSSSGSVPRRPVTALGHREMGATDTGTPVVVPFAIGHKHAWEDDPAAMMRDVTAAFRPAGAGDAEFASGILETERRYESLHRLFKLWDESSDISVVGSGTIEFSELCSVLQEYYSWSAQEAERRAKAVLDSIDRDSDGSMDWSEFQVFMTAITRGMQPRNFDALVSHFSSAITRVAEAQEAQRRHRLLGELFDEWDDDHSGIIDAEELERVLGRFNEGCTESGDDRELSELKLADSNGDGLDRKEFISAFTALTGSFTAASFDLMYYRLMRVLEDLVFADRRSSAVRGVTSDDLAEVVLRSTPLSPLILYGHRRDPSKAIERCAARFGAQLRPFLVTHEKAEQEALRAVSRLSMSRGWWVYIVVGQDYRCDALFREAGVKLQTVNHWAVHRKFRLWIKLPTRTLGGVPNILLQSAVAVSLDNPDASEVAASMEAPPCQWRMSVAASARRPTSATGVRGHTGRYA